MSVTVSVRTSMVSVTVVVHVRSQSKVPSAESAGRTHEQMSQEGQSCQEFFFFFRHIYAYTVHPLTDCIDSTDWYCSSKVPADLVSIRIYSGIARFPCDSMAFLSWELSNMQASCWWNHVQCGPPNQNFVWSQPTLQRPHTPAWRTYSNYGDRCFTAAGLKLWNSLPADLWQADINCQRFKQLLRSFLFGFWDHSALQLIVKAASHKFSYLMLALVSSDVTVDRLLADDKHISIMLALCQALGSNPFH